MLNTFTWGDFIGAMLPLLIIYYLVILLKYYRHELIALFSGRREPRKKELAAMAQAAAAAAERVPAQGDLFVGQAAGIAGVEGLAANVEQEGSPEMFKVMEAVITLLKGVIAKGVSEGSDKEQLVMQFEDVLGRYQQLRDTPYQHAINGFLERTCSSNFSLVLEDADLEALWG